MLILILFIVRMLAGLIQTLLPYYAGTGTSDL